MAHEFSTNGTATLTLEDNKTFTAEELRENTIWVIDPNGSRTLTLPDPADCGAIMCLFKNAAGGAEVMSFVYDGGTIITPTQHESAVLFTNGGVWAGIAGANS